jgi:putative SOS response-associated peptidase YedK
MRRLLRVNRDLTGNLPGVPAVYPMAPIIRTARDSERELVMMRWGFLPPPSCGTVPASNVRNLKSPYWHRWLKAQWRCLIPATSICEWMHSRPKVTQWFTLDESRPLLQEYGSCGLASGKARCAKINFSHS